MDPFPERAMRVYPKFQRSRCRPRVGTMATLVQPCLTPARRKHAYASVSTVPVESQGFPDDARMFRPCAASVRSMSSVASIVHQPAAPPSIAY